MKAKKSKEYNVTGKLWLYPGELANWHFFTIPKKESSELKDVYTGHTKGWGSLPVVVTLGETTWKTSIFPDNKSGTFLLPVKVLVRKKEELMEGDMCTVSFVVMV